MSVEARGDLGKVEGNKPGAGDDGFKVLSVNPGSPSTKPKPSADGSASLSSQSEDDDHVLCSATPSLKAGGITSRIVGEKPEDPGEEDVDLDAELAAFEADAAEEIDAAAAHVEGEAAIESKAGKGDGWESDGSADVALEEAEDAREEDEQAQLRARVAELRNRMMAKRKKKHKRNVLAASIVGGKERHKRK